MQTSNRFMPAGQRALYLAVMITMLAACLAPGATVQAGKVSANDYLVVPSAASSTASPGAGNVVAMGFDLPVNNNGVDSITDSLIHFGNGAGGPALAAVKNSLTAFGNADFWADANMSNDYTGNAAAGSAAIRDWNGQLAQESIIREGGGNHYPTYDANSGNLESSDMVLNPGSFGVVGMNVFPLTNTNGFNNAGYVYFDINNPAATALITPGMNYPSYGVVMVSDLDRNGVVSAGARRNICLSAGLAGPRLFMIMNPMARCPTAIFC